MPDFQTITQLLPNFADRVENPPASQADQDKTRDIFIDLLGQSADFIQPVLFRSGKLMIYVQAAVWGQHIAHRHDKILTRANAAGLFVKAIKVKVRPASHAQATEKSPLGAGYDTRIALTHLQKCAAQIKEPVLKQKVLGLAQRIQQNYADNIEEENKDQ